MRQRTHPDLSELEVTTVMRPAPSLLFDPGCKPGVSSRRSTNQENRSFAGSRRHRRQVVFDDEIAVGVESHADLVRTGSGRGGSSSAEKRCENALAAIRSDTIASAEKQSAATSEDAPVGGHCGVEIIDPPDLTCRRDAPNGVWRDCRSWPVDDDIGNRVDPDGVIKSNQQTFPIAVAGRRQRDDNRHRQRREQSRNNEMGSFAAPEFPTAIHCCPN
jgi:hypothetical protein